MRKKGQIHHTLRNIIIGVFILVLLVIGISILVFKGTGAIDYIKSLLRFGRG